MPLLQRCMILGSVKRLWDRISRQRGMFLLASPRCPTSGQLTSNSAFSFLLPGNRYKVVTVTVSYVYRGGKFGTRDKINVNCNVFEKDVLLHAWVGPVAQYLAGKAPWEENMFSLIVLQLVWKFFFCFVDASLQFLILLLSWTLNLILSSFQMGK
jgi:hypothetical protein